VKKFIRSLLPYTALAIVVLVFAVITTQVVTAQVTTTTVPTWKVQTSPAKPFDKVAFVNAFSGLAVGAGGTIVTTTNGGTLWTERKSGTNVQLRDVAAIGLDHAWAVGDNGTIVGTSNGGLTYQPQPHPGGSPATTNLTGVAFPDHCYGYAVAANLILKFSYP